MGVAANKCVLRPLGVDTELFKPIVSDTEKEKRLHMRTQLGFSPEDIICIYTGRLTHRKNPLCLAQAIELLAAKGLPFKAFFVGNGPQEEILRSFPKSCVVHPLVNYFDLPTYYQLADIAVWPVEYTTSMLEAAACGIPIVINENIQARERVEGNGMTYKENDPTDLARSLALLGDAERRKQLGQMGAQKMVDHFSWKAVAQRTLSDFEHATKLSAK
jgi:glycosyltransferase involved in cell wall biosynthesis